MADEDKQLPMRKGLLELAVLQLISGQEVYVADIIARLATTEFKTGEGTLYPLLSKLRREGLLEYSWIESDAGPPRKYYSLTTSGKSAVRELTEYLEKIHKTIQQLASKQKKV